MAVVEPFPDQANALSRSMRSVVNVQGQLGLEGIPARLVRVTPARLAVWEQCPRKYRLTYLERAGSRSGAWAHNTLGAVIHNALRAFFDQRPSRRTPERAVSLLRQYWKADGFADVQHAAHYRERAMQWVRDYVAGAEDANPIALERWVSAPAGSILAEGRVDRIDQRSGELVVIDYKTGRHVVTPDDAKNSRALALYALGSRKTLGSRCRRVELHHVPTGTVAGWDHTEDSLDEHVRGAEQLAEQIRAASELSEQQADPDRVEQAFPPRPGRHCSWCGVRAHCVEGQRAAPELASWALLAGSATTEA